VKTGETPGYPRFHGAKRYHSFTDKQFGNGVTLDGSDKGFLVVSKSGRLALRWRGRPRRSRSGEKRMATLSASPVPMCQYSRFPPTGQETGIDLGIAAFAPLCDGTRIFHPGFHPGW
jgi:hypothetical protein